MEDICDNLFNLDPYYQQGGDMVRIGGLSYSCTPSEKQSAGGFLRPEASKKGARAIEPGKRYTVAGWAAVNAQQGIPVWDVLAKHLGSGKPLSPSSSNVALRGVTGNPGLLEPG